MKTFPTLLIILLLLARINFADAQPCKAGFISAQKDSICSSTIAKLTVTGSSGSIQWQQTDSILGNFTNITGATDTSYQSGQLTHDTYYRVIAKTGSTCADTSLVFKITTLTVPVSKFNYHPTDSLIAFNSSESTGAFDFLWDFGDGTTSTEADPLHYFNFDIKTHFNVCLGVENHSECYSTICQSIYKPDPSCYAYFILVRDDKNPHVWYLQDESNANQDTNWDIFWGDGSQNKPFPHIYTSQGKYQICLYYDQFGHPPDPCNAGYCDSTSYLQAGDTVIIGWPPVITKISIYPNPCSTCFIEGVNNETDILINDIMGRRMNAVLTKTANGLNLTLPNSPPGIYFVRNIKTGQAAKFVLAVP